MKPFDVKSSTYIDFGIENKPKNKVGDQVKISKYKNTFGKGCISNRSNNIFVIKKVNNTVPYAILLVILMEEKLLKSFVEKNYKKQIKKSLELKKQSREEVITNISNEEVMIIHLIVGLIKKT